MYPFYTYLIFYGKFGTPFFIVSTTKSGAVARSEACPLGMQAASSSIPTSGTLFRGDLFTKKNLQPFSLFR